MKEEEFISLVNKYRINNDYFSINNELKEGAFVLYSIGGGLYKIFYLENGEWNDERLFLDKESALSYLFDLLKRNYVKI